MVSEDMSTTSLLLIGNPSLPPFPGPFRTATTWKMTVTGQQSHGADDADDVFGRDNNRLISHSIPRTADPTYLPLMAPFYDAVCQGAWGRDAFEGAPALVGVNVVRP